MKMNLFRYLGNRLIPIDDLLCAYLVTNMVNSIPD